MKIILLLKKIKNHAILKGVKREIAMLVTNILKKGFISKLFMDKIKTV